MRSLLYIIFLCTPLLGWSSAYKVVIKGKAPQFVGKSLSIYNHTDYITYREKRVTSDIVQKEGYFQTEFDIENTQYILIRAEDKTAKFFVEPGKVYTLDVSFDQAYNPTQVYDKALLLKQNFASPTELNQLIASFNRDYEDFLLKNRTKFLVKGAFKEIKKFREKMIKKYKEYGNTFLDQYIDYSLGNMMDATNAKDEELFKLFFKDRPVLLNVDEYMKLFAQFFQKDLRAKCIAYDGLPYKNAINQTASIKSLDILLQKDPYLADNQLRELYILYGLNELYNDPIFEKNNVLNMVNYVYETTQYPGHKIIAYNIVAMYTNLKQNAPAPEFTLTDSKNKPVTLADFQGKYVYINFWAGWSIPSQKEMRIMEKLYQVYGKEISFVSINCDPGVKTMNAVKNKYNYPWTFLHLDEKSTLLEEYNVRVIPTYILIDPQGRIVYAPAERPSGYADRQLAQVLAASKPPKKKYKVGEK